MRRGCADAAVDFDRPVVVLLANAYAGYGWAVVLRSCGGVRRRRSPETLVASAAVGGVRVLRARILALLLSAISDSTANIIGAVARSIGPRSQHRPALDGVRCGNRPRRHWRRC